MDSAWGIKPGSWAEDVEQEEAKNGPLRDEEAFPTLGEAVSKEPKAAKTGGKKKPVKMGLTDFLGAQTARRTASDKEILMALPKGSSGLPREDRDAKGLGGGFKDYGGNRAGFGDDREGRSEREPSRADASGDWGAERKFTPSDSRGGSSGFGGGFSRDRGAGGGFGDRPPREDRPVSEADTADDWGANRKFTPSGGAGGGGGSFGGGFSRDREGGERGGGFRDRPARFEDGPSRADEGDWGARRAPQPGPEREAGPGARRGYGFSEQPVSQADMEDRWSHRAPPAGAAAANGETAGAPERPRLKLAPRTKPLEHPPAAADAAAAAVAEGTSPHSDAGSSSSSQRQQQQARKSNPFGAARPREEVLKEKGIDYQKEELKLEHGEVIRDKAPEEADMEKEVEELRVRLEGLKELTPGETDTISELAGELDEKEKALYRLQAELDDKVRFSKSRPERERSADPVGRSSSNPAAAAAPVEGEAGFVEVRNPRKERSAAAGPAAEGAAAAAPEREGSGGAWARGGNFKDSKGEGRGEASFSRGRGEAGRSEGSRGEGGRDARGGRGDERGGGAPGRSGGGW